MTKNRKLTISALLLSIDLLLPFLTGQIPQIGSMLCPMHIPVLLCGFICGWPYAAAIGLIAPSLRFLLFGMPPLFPVGIAMTFELCAYGFASGYLYNKLPKKNINIYASLIIAMIFGRIVWGFSMYLISAFTMVKFSLSIFMTGAFINAIPGIVAQIIIVPSMIIVLKRTKSVANV